MIQKLRLHYWMNHKQLELTFTPGINLILGPNGSGKTNILEALYFAFYGETSKSLKLLELTHQGAVVEKRFRIHLDLNYQNNLIQIKRELDSSEDYLKINGELKAQKRENVTKMIEQQILRKEIYDLLVYNRQFNMTDIVEATPVERERIFNTLLGLDKLLMLDEKLKEFAKEISWMISEYTLRLGQLQEQQKVKKTELTEKMKEVLAQLKQKESERDWVINLLQNLERARQWQEKLLLLQKLLQLRLQIKRIKEDIQLFNKSKELYLMLDKELNIIKTRIKEIQSRIQKLEKLKAEGKCLYCERPLSKTDYEHYSSEIYQLQTELKLLQDSELKKLNELQKIKQTLATLEKKLVKNAYNQLMSEYGKIRHLFLQIPPFKKLKQTNSSNAFVNYDLTELNKQITEYQQLLEQIKQDIIKLKAEKEHLEKYIKRSVIEDYEQQIQSFSKRIESLKELNEQIQLFRNLWKRGNITEKVRKVVLSNFPLEKMFKIFNVGNLTIKEGFELTVDGVSIKGCSGGQKILINLLLKFLFAQFYAIPFIILDEPTIYLDSERREILNKLFQYIKHYSIIPQMIIVTHDPILEPIADQLIHIQKLPS